MPQVAPFYSINEINKPPHNRVHHNNSACPPGRDIPMNERTAGNGPGLTGYRLCDDCDRLNRQGK
jgi:hypothetical protein